MFVNCNAPPMNQLIVNIFNTTILDYFCRIFAIFPVKTLLTTEIHIVYYTSFFLLGLGQNFTNNSSFHRKADGH
jgi:hypothetical protein